MMLKFKKILFLSTLFCSFYTKAQNGTEIYLADIQLNETSASISNLKNITNRAGYDNQPYFMPDNKTLLFSSIREDNQSDIYLYDLIDRTEKLLFKTTESEYSPQLMADGKNISTVRVEKDETQRLWKINIKDSKANLVAEKVDSVGYYCWMDKENLALFILGEPNTLRYTNIKTQEEKIIAENIGRSLFKHPQGNNLFFIDKSNAEEWQIKIAGTNGKIEWVVNTFPETEDFCFAENGMILTIYKGKLFGYYPGASRSWFLLADIPEFSEKIITRITLNKQQNKIAFVIAE
jgi:hypothetical protein